MIDIRGIIASPLARRSFFPSSPRIVFDLLYHAGLCLLREPLARRREMLAEACQPLDAEDVRFSAGVIGAGNALYEAAITGGHEGVMAKHLASTYRPGRHSAAGRKIKPRPKGTT